MKCCVKNCNNKYYKQRNNNKRFFQFPTNPTILKKWLQFTGKKVPVLNSYRVCEDHFADEDIIGKLQCDLGLSRRLLLKKTAVPSILDPNEELSERSKRLKERMRHKLVESILKESQQEEIKKVAEIEFVEVNSTVENNIPEVEQVDVANASEEEDEEDVSEEEEEEKEEVNLPMQIEQLKEELKLLKQKYDTLISMFRENQMKFESALNKKDIQIRQIQQLLIKYQKKFLGQL